MSVRVLAASLIAALSLTAASIAAAPGAAAADLGEGYDPRDPGYADDGYYPPPQSHDYGGRDADDDDDGDDDRRYAHRDNDDDDDDQDEDYRHRRHDRDGTYLAPLPRPPHFGDGQYRNRQDCVPPWRIKSRLRHDGWTAFRDLSIEGNTAVVRATRIASGRTFTLRVDRCSGAVVNARPLPWRSYGAYVPLPRRY